MKNLTYTILLSTVFLFAGGKAVDAGSTGTGLSAIASISGKTCKKNKVYDEYDVHLMWQDQPYTDPEDSAYKRNHSLGKVGSWNHAINYCRRLNYFGYNNWRLPTSAELSRVHRKIGEVFTYPKGYDFWSSSATEDSRQYVVFPADAYQYKRTKRQSNYIRCVRCTIR